MLHASSVLSPERGLLAGIPLGRRAASLHRLRRRRHALVRPLRRYYLGVRLPTAVHHRLIPFGFTIRPGRAGPEDSRISRFSRRLLTRVHGALDHAEYPATSPNRELCCCLLHAPTGSALGFMIFSQLNTEPTRSPVNAPTAPLQAPTHDAGPSCLVKTSMSETFILYNLPVYPGARLLGSRLSTFRGSLCRQNPRGQLSGGLCPQGEPPSR